MTRTAPAAFLIPLTLIISSVVFAGNGEPPFQVASGPFAVAGSPDSYSVAWVEKSQELESLWLRVEGQPGSSRLHLVAGDVEREAGIFLEMNPVSVALAFKNADGWKIGYLDRRNKTAATIRTRALAASDHLLNISLREDGAGLIALLLDDSSGVSRLVEFNLKDETSRTLHQINETISASAVAALSDRTAVVWSDPEGRLVLEILDASGRLFAGRRLNVFPVAGPAPVIGRYEQTITVAWSEGLPDGLEARIARVSADGTVRLLESSEPVPADRAGRIVASRGDGRLLVREWGGESPASELMLLDGRTDPACGPTMVDSRRSSGSWLLGSGENALLFRSLEIEEGRFSLTSRSVRCGIESSARESLVRGSSPSGGGSESSDETGRILSGSADPCNGFDDDGDGILDNGCDLVCDAPQVAIGPLDLVNQAWESTTQVVVRAGNEFGVAFVDGRGANSGIFFARMDESGNVVYERRITADTHWAGRPTLVWTGAQYGLAWQDNSTGRNEIFVSILNSDGSESTSPRLVSDICSSGCAGIGGMEPSIGWRGSEYGVVFSSNRNGNDEIFYARLQPTGVKIGTDIPTNSGTGSRAPSLVWAGTEWGVAWTERLTGGSEEIYFGRLHEVGPPLAAPVQISNAAGGAVPGRPSLAWTGTEYGLAWHDDRSGGYEIYFSRRDSSGSGLGVDARITTSSGLAVYPSLVWTGGEFAVSWNDTRGGGQHAYTARISSTGVKQGGDFRVSAPPAHVGRTSLAWSGTGQVLVWEDFADGVWGLRTGFVRCCDDMDGDGYTECAGDPNDQDPGSYPGGPDACDGRDNNGNGVVDENCDGLCVGADNFGGDLRVSDGGAAVYSAAIAWNGSEFGVAWRQTLGGSSMMFQRLDAGGQPIGAATNVIANAGVLAMIWTGTEYGVLANGATGAMLVRLDATGGLIGTTDFDAMGNPAMVWNGNEYAVVTDEFLFYRIDAAGNQIGQPVDLGITAALPYPDLVWDGTGYGLVYNRGGLYFQRFDANGALIGGQALLATDGSQSSIVWTGSEYGVAWNYANGASDNGIRFVRLSSAGVIQGTTTTVTSAFGNSQAPVVRWTGEEYGVAWQDDQYGLDWIFFRRLTSSGATNGSTLRAMDPQSTDARNPALVWNGTDYAVVSRYSHVSSPAPEAWFQIIRCCGQSADGDGYGKCEDCDDQNGSVYPFAPQICDGFNNDCYDPAWPLLDGTNEADLDGDAQSECGGDCDETDSSVYTGAPELCDFRDNDCDTVEDEGFPVPGPVTFKIISSDKETIEWNVVEFADRYDVVRGDLATLRASRGDFAETVDTCLADDLQQTGLRDSTLPTTAGQVILYLVRAQAACKDGTYDTAGQGQVQKRDSEIENAPGVCP